MKKTVIFEKEYCGESISDLPRDINEAFDPEFNKLIRTIPVDEYGFLEGYYKIHIERTFRKDESK